MKKNKQINIKDTFLLLKFNERQRVQKPSALQKNHLVDFLTKHPNLASNKITNSFTANDSKRLWRTVSAELNKLPGSRKDAEQWKRTWLDIKRNFITRLSRYSQSIQDADEDEPIPPLQLQEVEEKIKNLITDTVEIYPDPPRTASEITVDFSPIDRKPQALPTIEQLSEQAEQHDSITQADNVRRRKPTRVRRIGRTLKLLEMQKRAINETAKYRAKKLQLLQSSIECKKELNQSVNRLNDNIVKLLNKNQSQFLIESATHDAFTRY